MEICIGYETNNSCTIIGPRSSVHKGQRRNPWTFRGHRSSVQIQQMTQGQEALDSQKTQKQRPERSEDTRTGIPELTEDTGAQYLTEAWQ